MFKVLQHAISRESPATINALGMTLVFILGGLDVLSGPSFSFSVFYLLPIAFVTWFVRPSKGYMLCAISFIVLLGIAIAENQEDTRLLILLWNAVSPLLIFLFAVRLLKGLKSHLQTEQTMSRTDNLTHVLNARGFEEVASRIFLLATRHHHPTALAYLDIDNFKEVNDRQGHSEGDRVLQTVAEALKRCVRGTDAVGRLGGDEFAILMPETSFKGAKITAEKVHQELLRTIASRDWRIGFSIGVAAFPALPPSIDDALKVADRLMYRAKKDGKNHVVCELQPVQEVKPIVPTDEPAVFTDTIRISPKPAYLADPPTKELPLSKSRQ